MLCSQMGPRTHGGWAEAVRSTSTGEVQDPASKNVPVASTGTALTPSTTATVTLTSHSGKSLWHPLHIQQEKHQLESSRVPCRLSFALTLTKDCRTGCHYKNSTDTDV